MAIGLDYDPKYIALDDIPLSGPDEYEDDEKRKALFHAETRLESDVNDGDRISDLSVTNMHKLAVVNLATHVLTHSAREPSEVKLGDMADDGGAVEDYSSEFKERYDDLVDSLHESDAETGGIDNYTYTTK